MIKTCVAFLLCFAAIYNCRADNEIDTLGLRGDKMHMEAIKKRLKKNPELIKELEAENEPILHGATSEDNVKMIRFLVSLGASVDAKSKDYKMFTALMIASREGKLEAAKVLLELGADVNITDKYGETALEWAAFKHHTEIVKLLLNQKDEKGTGKHEEKVLSNALLSAVLEKHQDGDKCAIMLIDAGAKSNINLRRSGYATHLACTHDYAEALAAMIKKGAKLDVLNPEDQTPLEVAVKNGSAKCVNVLLDAGVKVTDAVMKAAEDGDNNDIIDMLDKHAAKKNK